MTQRSTLTKQSDGLLAALKKRRELLGLSQEDVARRMKTRQPAIARLEAGEKDPRLSTLCRYAAAVDAVLALVWRPV